MAIRQNLDLVQLTLDLGHNPLDAGQPRAAEKNATNTTLKPLFGTNAFQSRRTEDETQLSSRLPSSRLPWPLRAMDHRMEK